MRGFMNAKAESVNALVIENDLTMLKCMTELALTYILSKRAIDKPMKMSMEHLNQCNRNQDSMKCLLEK